MERLDVRCHRENRSQLGLCLDEKLGPWSLDRHRFHFPTVVGEPAIRHQAPFGKNGERPPVRRAIEWNGELEIGRVDA